MKRSKHALSNYKLCTMDMGQLVPVGITEVLPGDTIQQSSSALIRVSPLVAPVMHPVQVRIHHWFVPNRILWDSWEDFITGGQTGNDVSVPPTITTDIEGAGQNHGKGYLLDYMGVPIVAGLTPSALPIRAYNMIFNEYYRDQDLVTAVDEDSTVVQNVAWEKDYFTAARPWTQRGDDVTIPLGDEAPVRGIGSTAPFDDSGSQDVTDGGDDAATYPHASPLAAAGKWFADAGAAGGHLHVFADLSNATGASINDVRMAFALQRYKEARALYGARYSEYLKYLGVNSSDARLQSPEYLGGGKSVITFSEILQTGPDASDDEGVGRLKGHGIAAIKTRRYRKFIEEHGFVITLMSLRPRTMYADGLNRMWSRTVKEDYWQKELEDVGSQEILNKEVYAAAAAPNDGFGFQDRYAEYRHIPSTIAADFRDTLNHYHLARLLAAEPDLNSDFVTCNPSKRIHAVQTDDVLWCMVSHSIQARRMVSKRAGRRVM